MGAAAATPSKGPARRRHLARTRALQALYQWRLTGDDPADIEAQFLDEREMGKADPEYFHRLLHGVARRAAELDAQVRPFLERDAAQVDPVEQAILRIGVFELAHCPEVPYRVVINEAIELAKIFGAEAGHRFVNGVLDKAAGRLRPQEVAAGPRR